MDTLPDLPDTLTAIAVHRRAMHERIVAAIESIDNREDAFQLRGAFKDAAAEFRKLAPAVEGKCIELIDRDGDYVLGPARWYCGDVKDYDAIDPVALLEEIIKLTCDKSTGEISPGKMLTFFASGWALQGAFRAALEAEGRGAEFGKFFTTTVKPEIREGKMTGKNKRVLVEAQ